MIGLDFEPVWMHDPLLDCTIANQTLSLFVLDFLEMFPFPHGKNTNPRRCFGLAIGREQHLESRLALGPRFDQRNHVRGE
jgi:hypothetical protein